MCLHPRAWDLTHLLDPAALRARLERVRDRIASAAGRVGRDPASVRLVAVSKTFPPDYVRAAAQAGQLDFGESRVQEAFPKMDETRDLPLRWHLVGHLQSNKARRAAERFDVIHSVDDPALGRRVDLAASEAGRVVDCLIQVDLAGEPTKHGVQPSDLEALVTQLSERRAARLKGLMLLPPAGEPEAVRPYFAALRRLRDDLLARGIPLSALSELSMGMSGDFEVAIEEGATIVRVGTALFGEREGSVPA
jgi:pyridoxal phosphate enzyme (YggS family)